MSVQNQSYRELCNLVSSQVYELSAGPEARRTQPLASVHVQRASAWPRCRAFLLIAFIAVIGEIAAFAAASALHLGTTATAIGLVGVVLSAVWPLTRSAA